MLDWKSVPVPAGLDARPRDVRGYPITFVTLVEADGRPDFTTIDAEKIVRCIRERLCGMCGEPLASPVAFIGGPLACANQNFLDPPMHVLCAEYAMQVCPHIAIPTSRYAKPNLEDRTLFQGVHPDRPEKFGLYVTYDYQLGSYMGQPVFLADEALTITWSDDAGAA